MISNTHPGRVIDIKREWGKRYTYRVTWEGRLCSPEWDQRKFAEAYLREVIEGKRKPDYADGSDRHGR